MALQVDPPKTNGILDIQQAWHKLIKKLQTEFVDTGWSNILFVDATDGNDASAQRGSLTFKYATIQAALDDAQAGDVVWVSPGTYTEDITWPVDVNDLTLRGAGIDQTTITNATAVTTVSVAPTDAGVTNFSIFDLEIANDGADHCLDIDGTGDVNLGSEDTPIWLQNVRLSAAGIGISLTTAAHVRMDKIYSVRASVECANYGTITATNCYLQDITLTTDAAATAPAAGFGFFGLDSSQAADVTVNEEARFLATKDTQLVNLTAAITDEGDGEYGIVTCRGSILGDVDITFVISAVANAGVEVAALNYARISGSFSFGGGGASEQARCFARFADFTDGSAGSIICDTYGILDLRDAFFTQQSLSSPDTLTDTAGSIDRSHWFETLNASGGANAITWGVGGGAVNAIPYPNDEYYVTVESSALASQPVAVSAKSTTGATVTDSAASGTLQVVVHRTNNDA